VYKLVDALEDVTDYWSFGRNFTTMPTYNVYIPTRHHLMDKPDMMDAQADDLSYKFNLNRLSPVNYLNTLKGYKMLPRPALKPSLEPHRKKFYKKYRRLSNPKMQGFSTSTVTPPENTPTFLQSILTYSSVYGRK